MTGIGLPIDIVVIHGADHVAIQKRRIDRIGLEAGNERRGFTVATALATGHRAIMLQQDFGVILLTAAKSTANGIEPK